MGTASAGRTVWSVFFFVSMAIMTACGGDDGDKIITCSDVDCGSVNRSCIEAVGPADAYCGGCSTGYFDNDGTCTEVTACTNAEYELSAPTAISDRQCASTTDCQANQYEKAAPTATSDRECAALSECHGSNRQIALSDQDIPTDGSATHDRVCCHLHTEDITVTEDGGWPEFDETCLYAKGNINIIGPYDADPDTLDAYDMMDDRLVVVEGDINPYGHVTDLQVFKNLEAVGGNIWFENHNIKNFKGLEKLRSIGGYLGVWDNPDLENFQGLENLQTIGKALSVENNDSLVSFEGLEQLTEIGRPSSDITGVYIGNHQNLVNFKGLENLEVIKGVFRVGGEIEVDGEEYYFHDAGNPKLENFKGLESLQLIEGDFDVFGNEALKNFEGLEGLETIGGDLFIGKLNESQTSFYELDRRYGGRGNKSLVNFNGLQALKSIGGNLVVGANKQIENFQGLNHLETVGGELFVADEQELVNFEGAERLQSIGRNFLVLTSGALTSFDGLESLEFIGDSLAVVLNASLIDLSGLEHLTTVGESIDFQLNIELCEEFVDALAAQVGTTGNTNVQNNGVCP